MDHLPPRLRDGLCAEDLGAVDRWWSGLSEASRREVAALCDERMDLCLFGIAPEDADSRAPVVISGRFVPRDDSAGWAEWHAAYFDHLISNPELVYDDTTVLRTFHICTRHPAARAALAAGRIPADFRCPLASSDCPMRRLLDAARPGNGR